MRLSEYRPDPTMSVGPELRIMLIGLGSSLLPGMALIYSYDHRYGALAVASAVALALLLHLAFGLWLIARLRPTLFELAPRLFVLTLGGSFLALQVFIGAEDPSVFSSLGVQANIYYCWYCPTLLEQIWDALLTSVVLAVCGAALTPVPWLVDRLLSRAPHPPA
jgi:hypothetical protein